MTDIIYAPLNRYFQGEKTLVEWIDLVFRFFPKKKAIIEQFLGDNLKAHAFVYEAKDVLKNCDAVVPDTVHKKSYMSTFDIPDDDYYLILILGAIYKGFDNFDEVTNARLIDSMPSFIALWFADYIPYNMYNYSWDW